MESNFHGVLVLCLWALGICCLVWALVGFRDKRR